MTTENLNYLNIIAAIAFFVVPTWQAIFNKSESGLKRVTRLGWLMLLAAIYFGVISILSIKAATKEQADNKIKTDSIRNADKKDFKSDVDIALKKYGYKFNDKSKTIIKIDTVKDFVNPIMDIWPPTPESNPRFVPRNVDSIWLSITFGPINNGIAYNMRDKLICFSFINNKISDVEISKRTINESITSTSKSGITLLYAISIRAHSNLYSDTTYFYFKVLYSNKKYKGQDQSPLNKIYFIVAKPPVYSIKDFGDIFEINSQEKYLAIKKQLINNQYW